jgi:DNA-binding MarR family transcriptional regulator
MMMFRPRHEIGGTLDGAVFALGKLLGIGRPAKQLERQPPRQIGRNPFAGGEHPPDDLQAKRCHSAHPFIGSSMNTNSSNMNNRQELPWDSPRFRNWVAVARACHVLERALTVRLAPIGLKPAQLDVLMNLYRHPGMSQHDLARRLLVGRSNITMLLPQLEKRGLLRRQGDEKDKRILRLTLTEAGEELLMRALKIHMALIEAAMSQSTPEEGDLIGDHMRKVADLLKEA